VRDEKTSKIGLDVEEQPEGPYDLLRVTLPLPRMMFLPKETRDHLRAARREQLLAVRSLLDTAIRRLEQGPAAKPRRKAEKMEIE
jgi:hypothetical protein